MKRLAIILLILIVAAAALYLVNHYWVHRYDYVIAREAARYRLDPDLVWSIAYEESYFRPWKDGRDGEIGMMQVTPGALADWASENASANLQQRTASDPANFLRDPERNIQIACWYLHRAGEDYPDDVPGREARMLAAYNAGRRRAIDWNRVDTGARPLTEQAFIERIDIASTRAYVTSILKRYRRVKSSKGGFSLLTQNPGLSREQAAGATLNAKDLFSSLGPADLYTSN
jgi:soluble lytic murein transglycosylase